MHAEAKSTMTSEHSSFEKYTSRTFFEMVAKGLCERWIGDWTDCNILTPSSFVFSSTSFSFCWAAQLGVLRAHSPLLGAGSLYSILSPTNRHQTNNFLSHRVISLFDIHLLPVSVASAPNSTPPQSRFYADIFDRMHLFLDWRLGRRSICYNYAKLFETELFCMLNWISWNRNVFNNQTILMLKWIVWNRTVFKYKNAFGVI